MLHSKLLPKESYDSLAPEKKEDYVSIGLKQLLKDYFKTGLTARQMEEKTYFHRNTISKHLMHLISTRQLYVHEDKKLGTVYHINGNVEHPSLVQDIFDEENKRQYSITLLKNAFNKFVYIQELSKNAYAKQVTTGGVLITPEKLDSLIEALVKFREEIKTISEGEKT